MLLFFTLRSTHRETIVYMHPQRNLLNSWRIRASPKTVAKYLTLIFFNNEARDSKSGKDRKTDVTKYP